MSLNYYDLNGTTIEDRFAAFNHGHAIADVTNLQSTLDGYQVDLSSTTSIDVDSISVSGNIVPDALNTTATLGTASNHFAEAWIDAVHIAQNTLYLGDTPVIGTNTGTVEVKADLDQGITVKTTGTGESKMISQNGVEISTSGLNGQIVVQSSGAGGQIAFGATSAINFTAPDANFSNDVAVTGNALFNTATFSGDVTFQGTNYTVDSQNVSTSDNRIVLNAGEVGNGVTSQYAGFEIDRGGLANWQLVFNETTDKFQFGEIGGTQYDFASESYVTSAIAGKLDTTTFNTTYTAADVLTKIKTVDGVGSGLDADTFQGYSPSSMLNPSANDLLLSIKSVDGASSGLDADLLDGKDSVIFEDETVFKTSSNDGDIFTPSSTKETRYYVDTSTAAFSLSLPQIVTNMGEKFVVVDHGHNFDTNNLTILKNGHNIEGLFEDLICDVKDSVFTLQWINNDIGWKVV